MPVAVSVENFQESEVTKLVSLPVAENVVLVVLPVVVLHWHPDVVLVVLRVIVVPSPLALTGRLAARACH